MIEIKSITGLSKSEKSFLEFINQRRGDEGLDISDEEMDRLIEADNEADDDESGYESDEDTDTDTKGSGAPESFVKKYGMPCSKKDAHIYIKNGKPAKARYGQKSKDQFKHPTKSQGQMRFEKKFMEIKKVIDGKAKR